MKELDQMGRPVLTKKAWVQKTNGFESRVV